MRAFVHGVDLGGLGGAGCCPPAAPGGLAAGVGATNGGVRRRYARRSRGGPARAPSSRYRYARWSRGVLSAWGGRRVVVRCQACQDVSRDHDLTVLLGGSFDEFAFGEGGAGSDEGDQVRRVDGAPAALGCLNEFERHRQPGRAGAGALGDLRPEPHGGECRLDRIRGSSSAGGSSARRGSCRTRAARRPRW